VFSAGPRRLPVAEAAPDNAVRCEQAAAYAVNLAQLRAAVGRPPRAEGGRAQRALPAPRLLRLEHHLVARGPGLVRTADPRRYVGPPLLVQLVGSGQPVGQRPLRASVPGRRGHPDGGVREEGQGGGQAGRHRGGGSRGNRRQGRCRGGGCRGSQAARSGGALQTAGERHRGGPGDGGWRDLQGVLQHEPGPVAHSARVQEADAAEGRSGQVQCPPEEGERAARSRVAGDAGDARRGGG